MSRPSLEAIVDLAVTLADDLERIIGRVPPQPSKSLQRRALVLEAQVSALRNMDPDASGFLPERLSWSNGKAVSVVLPLALERMCRVDLVERSEVDRCVSQALELAELLRRREENRAD